MNRRMAFCAAVLVGVSAAAPQMASAQATNYPNRVMQLVVPYAAGGSSDAVMRVVAEEMSQILKQQIVVNNRAGGGGTIAAQAAVQAPADGYTLLAITSTFPSHKAMYKTLPYDMDRDLVPVAMMVTLPMAIVVHNSFPAKTVKEFVQIANGTNGGLSYATAGRASTPHLAAEIFQHATQANLVHVPYKGEGPATTDLYGGHIKVMFSGIGTATAAAASPSARVLAVTGLQRSSQLPNVPTVAEQGYPGFEVTGWFGLAVKAGTPPEIVKKLNEATNAALANPVVAKKLTDMGNTPAPMKPEELAARIKRDTEQNTAALKRAGVEPE